MINRDNPLVSIITVVYNGEAYLQQTISSVLNQTYNNIEYIIVDGGSKDGTLDIINKNKHNLAKWVSEPDNGLYDAMNKGVGMAKGELIGMINSDDWYELNAVELIVDLFRSNKNKSIFHADRFDVNESGERTVRKFHKSIMKFKYYGMTYNHPGMFVTRSEYKKHRYNHLLKSHSDYQFVLEAFLRDPSVFCYLEKPIVNYRLDGISAQQSKSSSIKENFKARRNAGYGILRTCFATCFGVTISLVLKFLYLFRLDKK